MRGGFLPICTATAVVALACAAPKVENEHAPHDATSTSLAHGDAALHVALATGATSVLVEGALAANGAAEFLLSGDQGEILMAHVLSPEHHLGLSVRRLDTGEELAGERAPETFFRGSLPATTGSRAGSYSSYRSLMCPIGPSFRETVTSLAEPRSGSWKER